MTFIANNFNVEEIGVRNEIINQTEKDFFYFIRPNIVVSHLYSVFSALAPYFFIKIIFDVVRYYSKWFKAEKRAILSEGRANKLEINRLQLEQEKMELQIDNLHLERDFLKAQLNPHFLFNIMNNLYGMAQRQNPKTPALILQISEIMRYTLYQSNETKVLLAKELAFLKDYIALETMRHEANCHITCCIDDSDVASQLIAPLLTFTFVENAFKYGLKAKNLGFLQIKASVIKNFFYFSIHNDKLEEEVGKKGDSGIGIANVRRRLESLYRGKYQLRVEDRGDSFYVQMEIDLKE